MTNVFKMESEFFSQKNFNQVEGKADGVSYLLASGFPLISGDFYATPWALPPTELQT